MIKKATYVAVLMAGLCSGREISAKLYQGERSWAFTDLKPDHGPPGTVVTLLGYGFGPGLVVRYEGRVLKPLAMGKRFVRVQVPQDAESGWFEVTYRGRSLRAPRKFTVVIRPVVEALEPSASCPDTWIVVRGKHLTPAMTFWIGRFPVKKQYVDAGTVRIFVYRGLRAGYLSYRWKGRKYRTRLRFRPRALPRLRGIQPPSGWYGARIRILGSRFCEHPKVTVGGKVAKVLGRDRRGLLVEVPVGAQNGQVVVSCCGRTFTVPGRFELRPPQVEVTRVRPEMGPEGSWIEILGRGFRKGQRFWLGRTLLTRVQVLSPGLVRAFVPKGAVSGPVSVEAFGRRYRTSIRFQVLRRPVVVAVDPSSGWYGDRVRIRGRGFCPSPRVSVGGRPARVLESSSRAIRIEVPEGIRGGRILVQCLQWTVPAPTPFRLRPPRAEIRAIEPLFGPPGTKLIVRGRGLAPTDSFFLDKVRMPGRYISSREFRLTVPRAARSGRIVYVHFGRRHVTRFRFQVGWPRPILASYAPRVAWYGDEVVLRGRRICQNPRVLLGGHPLPVLRATSQSIRVRLPEGVRSGNLVVVCPKHRVVVRPKLRVKPPYAQVFSVFPKAGPWGTWVTLTGDNFRPDTKVWLGDQPLEVKYETSYRIRVRIPRGAKGGPFVVEARGKRVETGQRFKVVFPVPLVRAFEPPAGWYGQEVVVRGSDFCLDPVVFLGKQRAARVRRVSSAEIRFRVPKGAKTGRIAVVCYGNKRAVSPKAFVLAPPLPIVTSVEPDRGDWNRWITIRGKNFTPKTRFYLGRIRLKVSFKSPEMVQVFIPAGARSGLIYVESYGRRRDSTFSYVVRRKRRKSRR